MFQSSQKRMRAWLAVVDDMLVGAEPVDAPGEEPAWLVHPHRQPLSRRRARRPGTVPAAPAHCLCPIRPAYRDDGRPSVGTPGR